MADVSRATSSGRCPSRPRSTSPTPSRCPSRCAMPDPLTACGAATDTGRLRENNEDRYWADPDDGVYPVADGLGGEAAGDRAADLAVEAVRPVITAAGDAKSRVRSAIVAANDRIYADALAH